MLQILEIFKMDYTLNMTDKHRKMWDDLGVYSNDELKIKTIRVSLDN
jgi:hypothetical protein